MKKLFLATLAIISLVACNQTSKKTDLQKNNLTGKVKSVRTIGYDAVEKFGQIEKGKILLGQNDLIIYNEQGNEIERNFYHSDGSLDEKFIHKYDDKGNGIESNSYNSDGNLDKKSTYKYDNKGNKIDWNLYNSDGSLDLKRTYKYDNKGNQIEEKWYGSLDEKWTYKYNDRGDIIELNIYNSDGSFSSKIISKYEYDNQGNWIKRIDYNHNTPSTITERQIEYY